MEKITITCRIAPRDYKRIKHLIKIGRFESVEEFVQVSVENLVNEEYGKVQLDKKTIKHIRDALGIQS